MVTGPGISVLGPLSACPGQHVFCRSGFFLFIFKKRFQSFPYVSLKIFSPKKKRRSIFDVSAPFMFFIMGNSKNFSFWRFPNDMSQCHLFFLAEDPVVEPRENRALFFAVREPFRAYRIACKCIKNP